MRPKTGSFVAVDQQGHMIRVLTSQMMIDVRTHSDLHAPPMPGMMSLCLQDGKSVNKVGQGVYEVVQTGAILRSDAPDAP